MDRGRSGAAQCESRCRGDRTLDRTQALGRFIAQVERRAYRMAEIAIGNPDDALDIVQEAMLKLAERYASRPEAEWAPIFYRVLQSRITDWHRRRLVRSRWRVWWSGGADAESGNVIERYEDPHAVEPSSRLATDRFGQALEAALAALPARQQQAFLLRVWEGLDVADTARAMSCSQGSVKSHHSRAVHTLRERLREFLP